MVAYLVCAWTGDPPPAAHLVRTAVEAQPDWRVAAEDSQGLVFVRGPVWPRVRRLPASRGWVIGDLFRRSFGAGIGEEIESVLFSQRLPVEATARELCERYWGRYVAAIRAPAGSGLWGFRDPTGSVDAFAWSAGGMEILASQLPDWLPAEATPDLSIAWGIVRRWLAAPGGVATTSGLAGVTSITPGALRQGPNGELQVWRPADLARRDLGAADVAAALPVLLDACVGALTEDAQGLLAEISGGFDSAIVAASLARVAPAKVRQWINYYAPGRGGDERAFARAVAAHAGIELTEALKPPFAVTLSGLEAAASGLRPGLNGFDDVRDRDVVTRVTALEADRVVTGQGGDMVFFQTPTAVVARDRLKTEGLRGLGPAYLLGLSRWTRQSVWKTLSTAADHRAAWPGELGVLDHPWLAGAAGLPPGKRAQIAVLAQKLLLHVENLRARRAEIVHPLLSQPIVELCLAIPASALTEGGRDRGLARRAFAGRLPEAVRQRRGKGALTGYYGRAVASGLEALRPYLLEGRLAAEGLLDRDRLEVRLTREELIWRGDYFGVVMTAAVEAWVRHWEARRAQAQLTSAAA